jgi:hypothetical protein
MDTQLSKVTRPSPLIPRALRRGFERTGRTHALEPTALSGALYRRLLHLLLVVD